MAEHLSRPFIQPNLAVSGQSGIGPGTALQPRDYAPAMERGFGGNMFRLYTELVDKDMSDPENRRKLKAVLQHSEAFRDHLGLRHERHHDPSAFSRIFSRQQRSVNRMDNVPPYTYALAATLFDKETRVDRALTHLETRLQAKGDHRYHRDQDIFDLSFNNALLCLSYYLGDIPENCQLRALKIVERYLPRIQREKQQDVIAALRNPQGPQAPGNKMSTKAREIAQRASAALPPPLNPNDGRGRFQQLAFGGSGSNQTASGPSTTREQQTIDKLLARGWSTAQFEDCKDAIDEYLYALERSNDDLIDIALAKFDLHFAPHVGVINPGNRNWFRQLSHALGNQIAKSGESIESMSAREVVAHLRGQDLSTQDFETYKNAIDECLRELENDDDASIDAALAGFNQDFAQYAGKMKRFAHARFQELSVVIANYISDSADIRWMSPQEVVDTLDHQGWPTQQFRDCKKAIDECLDAFRSGHPLLIGNAVAKYDQDFAEFAGLLTEWDQDRFQRISEAIGAKIAERGESIEFDSPEEVIARLVAQRWTSERFRELQTLIAPYAGNAG